MLKNDCSMLILMVICICQFLVLAHSSNMPHIIWVPKDFSSIQAAIDAATGGDVILVEEGVYRENVLINKPLTLRGMGAVIEGCGEGHTVQIIANSVNFSGFRVVGSGIRPWCGIYVCYSLRCSITNNTVLNHYYGVRLYDSMEIVLKYNNLSNNRYNLEVWGLTLNHFIHSIDPSNIVNGRRVYYYVNAHNLLVPFDAGYVGIINSSKILVKDVSLSFNGVGVLIAYSLNCTVYNVTVSNNQRGIRMIASCNNFLYGNCFFENEWAGVVIDSSTNNTVCKNYIQNNSNGILLSYSLLLNIATRDNLLKRNHIYNNSCGARLNYVESNIIEQNDFRGNNVGLFVLSSKKNAFIRNYLKDNNVAIRMHCSRDNVFYYNSFLDHTVQVGVIDPLSRNHWDAGYPKGGNYWSNFEATDLYWGYEQNMKESDGIADGPYVINAGNKDRYPLMGPLNNFNVQAYNEIYYSVDIVSKSILSDFSYSYVNRSINFKVNCTDLKGFCRISILKVFLSCDNAKDWFVQINDVAALVNINEDENFTFIYLNFGCGIHYVSVMGTRMFKSNIFGDVNCDGKVDFEDLYRASLAYGSFLDSPRWNPFADVNSDCTVDLLDILLIVKSFGSF